LLWDLVWSDDSWLKEHSLKSVDSEVGDARADAERASKKPKMEITTNPRVYFDIEIAGKPEGRLTFEVTPPRFESTRNMAYGLFALFSSFVQMLFQGQSVRLCHFRMSRLPSNPHK